MHVSASPKWDAHPDRRSCTMPQFDKHFTLVEARAELTFLKRSFQELQDLSDAIKAGAPRHNATRKASSGNGGGGEQSGAYVEANVRFQELLTEIKERGIQIKDVDQGLVDFPYMMGDREVFLCWVVGEETISYWHEIAAGFAGRQLLDS